MNAPGLDLDGPVRHRHLLGLDRLSRLEAPDLVVGGFVVLASTPEDERTHGRAAPGCPGLAAE